MPIKKWLIQYLIAFPIIFVVLAGVQYLKGRSAGYAIEFGLFWSFLSIATFAIRRFYNVRKNISCVICKDLSKERDKSNDL